MVFGDIGDHHGVRSDAHIVSNLDRAEDFCPGTNIHIVAKRRYVIL